MPDEKVLLLQKQLNLKGYGPLKEDGQYGKNTNSEYRKYLQDLDASTPNIAPEPEIKWWMNRAIISSFCVILVGIIGVFGYELDSEALSQLILSLITVVTGAATVVSTFKNKSNIDRTNLNPFKPVMQMRTIDKAEDPRGFFKDI